MQQLPTILEQAVHAPFLIKYGLIVIASIIEGPIVFFVSGFLLKLGVLSLVPAFLSLVIGDLIGDSLWYFVGRRFGHAFIARFGKYVNVTEDTVQKVTEIFKKHDTKILVFSKVTNGFGLSLGVLITAGMTKLRFLKFITFNAIGEVAWTAILVTTGYFFGSWYAQINTWAGRVSLGFGLVLVAVIFLQWNKYLQRRANTPTT